MSLSIRLSISLFSLFSLSHSLPSFSLPPPSPSPLSLFYPHYMSLYVYLFFSLSFSLSFNTTLPLSLSVFVFLLLAMSLSFPFSLPLSVSLLSLSFSPSSLSLWRSSLISCGEKNRSFLFFEVVVICVKLLKDLLPQTQTHTHTFTHSQTYTNTNTPLHSPHTGGRFHQKDKQKDAGVYWWQKLHYAISPTKLKAKLIYQNLPTLYDIRQMPFAKKCV